MPDDGAKADGERLRRLVDRQEQSAKRVAERYQEGIDLHASAFVAAAKAFYGPGGPGGKAIDEMLDRESAARAAPVSDGDTVTVPWNEGAFSWVNGRWQKLKERDG